MHFARTVLTFSSCLAQNVHGNPSVTIKKSINMRFEFLEASGIITNQEWVTHGYSLCINNLNTSPTVCSELKLIKTNH